MVLHKWLMATVAVVSFSAFGSTGYTPKFDPSHLKAPATGIPNEVSVQGTAHLAALPANFDAKALQPSIARLEAWKPQIITIEALSRTQCDFMRRYRVRYAESVKRYCWDPAPARTATGSTARQGARAGIPTPHFNTLSWRPSHE